MISPDLALLALAAMDGPGYRGWAAPPHRDLRPPLPTNRGMARRNAPCPCGSGVKFKRCCWGKPGPVNQPQPTEDDTRDD